MDTLLLKLLVTPLLIGAASLAGRRWGETVSGWFIGLPLSSGPVCWFLALEQGTGFAAAAARGCLGGAPARRGSSLPTASRRETPAGRGASALGQRALQHARPSCR